MTDASACGIERPENIYEVDRKGICENCGTVATVVKHGHSDPSGGPFRGGDRVRCELTWPEEGGA